MPGLVWSDALSLSMPIMDATHQEFVELLGDIERADDTSLLAAWRKMVDHTDAHFAREDQWMRDTGFAADNCHSTQHAIVLEVLREALAHGERGHLGPLHQMVEELGAWFQHHAMNMDFGLSLHLKSLGYDPETGKVEHPGSLPGVTLQGCGDTCSPGSRAEPANA